MKTKEFEKYRVDPGERINLAMVDSNDASCFDGEKEEGREALLELKQKLNSLQGMFYATQKNGLLTVFQAMDTGGKDGVVRNVFSGMSPQGIDVVSFKAPSAEELAHDYLWRVHQHVPERGKMGVFIRSHYEDVGVVRVRGYVPRNVWSRRFDHINDFERMLTDEGVLVRKFWLSIDKDEQKQRLRDRADNPEKHWKFNEADLKERKFWDRYMEAYSDAIGRTSTENAPWYVIPANQKWYRDLAVASILTNTLDELNMKYVLKPGLDKLKIK